jgi:peptide/nickel transport system ATP-binding protein
MLAMRLLPEGSYRIHHGQVKLLKIDGVRSSFASGAVQKWR